MKFMTTVHMVLSIAGPAGGALGVLGCSLSPHSWERRTEVQAWGFQTLKGFLSAALILTPPPRSPGKDLQRPSLSAVSPTLWPCTVLTKPDYTPGCWLCLISQVKKAHESPEAGKRAGFDEAMDTDERGIKGEMGGTIRT